MPSLSFFARNNVFEVGFIGFSTTVSLRHDCNLIKLEL